MNNTFDELGFEIVRGMLQPETVELMSGQFRMVRDVQYDLNNIPRERKNMFRDKLCDNSFSKGHTALFEACLLLLQPKIEIITSKKLIPTYSYGRIYYTNSELKRHRDRFACEYSATICLDVDETEWPICIKGRDGNEYVVKQKPGDALIYKGCELEHWRVPFTGTEHVQYFLHYVDSEGSYTDKKYDGRISLGLPALK